MVIKDFNKKLDLMINDAKCELNYNRDYELVIATVLSAQCTDARVNTIIPVLFSKYTFDFSYTIFKFNRNNIIKLT